MTWVKVMIKVIKRPAVILHQLRLILANPYLRWRRVFWLAKLTGASTMDVHRYIKEVEHDKWFLDAVRAAFKRYTLYFPLPTDFMVTPSGSSMFFPFVSLYALVRLIRPKVVVETGGTPGKSSAFITRALERNGKGHLYTIDLPPPEGDKNEPIKVGEVHHKRPFGVESNWCMPRWLRSYQTLIIGPAQEHLPRLLNKLGKIDIFIHDSDHSYKHMRWELETAYPFVRTGGILIADDIRVHTAWQDFCTTHRLISYELGQMGGTHKGY